MIFLSPIMRDNYNNFFAESLFPGSLHLMAETKFVGTSRITAFGVPNPVLITMSCVIDRIAIADNEHIGNFVKMDIDSENITIHPDTVVQKGQWIEVTVHYISLPL